MRYKKTAAVLSLMSLSALLAACDVITAQHIPSSTTTAFNNGAGLGGRGAQMGMPGSFADNGSPGGMIDGVIDEVFDADIVGRIVKVNGSSVRLERVEQSVSATGDGTQSPGGAAEGQNKWTSTGETLTLNLGSEVNISLGSASARRGGRLEGAEGQGGREAAPENSSRRSGTDPGTGGGKAEEAATGSAADLKAGQIAMVWYKEGSKTVDRIRILQNVSE